MLVLGDLQRRQRCAHVSQEEQQCPTSEEGGEPAPLTPRSVFLAVGRETATRGLGAQECLQCLLLSRFELEVCSLLTEGTAPLVSVLGALATEITGRSGSPWQRSVLWAWCGRWKTKFTLGAMRRKEPESVWVGEEEHWRKESQGDRKNDRDESAESLVHFSQSGLQLLVARHLT